ncbi:MAG: ribonuclease HII [Planctomycetia bacterium]|nr:ribonuclease HII [Planctomycetia bacterium]
MEIIAGVDEAGRGPLAGPVVAAAVILSDNDKIEGLRDSKKLSAKKREVLFKEINEKAISVGIGIVDEKEIDRINILAATHKAMQMALGRLNRRPTLALIDGYKLPNQIIRNKGIIKGDTKVESIMAGSIIAKVTRDALMLEYDKIFPEYGFAKHKGYGTKQHIEAISEFKATPIHRKSFKPVSSNLPTITWLQKTKRVGVLGEQLAACRLMKDGHIIISMNENCAPHGEIDIISEKDNLLIFTEVKTYAREQITTPELKIDEQKLRKLENAINFYIGKHNISSDIRLNGISVMLGKNHSIKIFEGIELNFS